MARLLLIEPDSILGQTYGETLSDAGHQVQAAATAQGAIMAADTVRPDLVILELQLVEHSGIEFLYEFRSYLDWQAIPVIIHTHVPPAEFNDNAGLLRQELGVSTYLYKPYTSLRELQRRVNDALPVQV